MKKFFTGLFLTSTLFVATPADAATPQIKIDDVVVKSDTAPEQKNNRTMVPLRVIAEKLGFKVDSTGKGAILSKGNMSYTITRGEKTFGYNKALRTLTVAPTLKETKTYVPVEFVDEYLK